MRSGRLGPLGGSECLHIETARSDQVTAPPLLLVVLHGDSPFSNPRCQYDMARMIARENRDVIAIGVLRPGCADPSETVHQACAALRRATITRPKSSTRSPTR